MSLATYKAVIIDDELPAIESLSVLLSRHFKSVKIVGEATSVERAIQVIEAKQPDLIFLDIHLSDGSGFNVLANFEKPQFQVIFVTAFNKFALKAFRVNALDYILKPIDLNELKEALKKAEQRLGTSNGDDFKAVKENWFDPNRVNKKLAIRELDGVRYVKINQIVRCKSFSNYTEIFLRDGERIVTTRILKAYTEILREYGFFRIHQSHLVNLQYVKKIIKKDGLFVEMEGGAILELSRRKKQELFLQMEEMNL